MSKALTNDHKVGYAPAPRGLFIVGGVKLCVLITVIKCLLHKSNIRLSQVNSMGILYIFCIIRVS